MKKKLKVISAIVVAGFSLLLLGCSNTTAPTATAAATSTATGFASDTPTPVNTIESAAIEHTAVPTPTLQPPPSTATPAPATAFPDFIVGNYAFDQDLTTLRSLVQTSDGWEVVDYSLPPNTPFLPGSFDYQAEAGKLLYWIWPRDQGPERTHGAGPANLSAAQLSQLEVTTGETITLLPDNVVYARWLPEGQGYAYIFATENTYELRWQPATGEAKVLAIDVPIRFGVAPNGRYIAFTRLTDYELPGTPGVYLITRDTGEETVLYQEEHTYNLLHWTADSQQLFVSYGHSIAGSNYLWLAADGSFAYELPASTLSTAISEAVTIPEPSFGWSMNEGLHSFRQRIFFDNNIAVGIFSRFIDELGDLHSPWLTHLATFRLDPDTGDAEAVAFQPVPSNSLFLGWVEAGKTVMLFDLDTNTPLEIDIFSDSDVMRP